MATTTEKETTRTRTRQAPKTGKAEQTEAEQKAAAERKAEREAEAAAKREAREKEQAERKAAREAEAEAKKAEREAEKQAAREAKEKERAEERQALIDSGDLIEEELDGITTTYLRTEPKKDTVAQRASEVIERLKADAREIPYSGKELADEFGGGTVQWVSFFGMLRVLGLIEVYRFRTGERGGSGLAYRWVGD